MSEKKFLKGVFVLVFVALLFVAYGRYVESRVIKSAELVEVTNDSYIISYDGQEHIYSK